MNIVKRVVAGIAVLFLATCIPLWASPANLVVLEGSDATAFHQDPNYTLQLFIYLQNEDFAGLPVLVLGGVGLSGLFPSQWVLDPGYSLTGYNLAKFSAVYIESVGGCCTQADTSISLADQKLIGAAELTGLNVGIENYNGGPNWGPILPAALNALPSSDFGGFGNFGTAGGPVCTDEEIFTPFALVRGFTQPAVLNCWEQEAYLLSAVTPLGFMNLAWADPAYFGGGGGGSSTGSEPLGSAFLASGGTLGTTPEPSSILLMGSGVLGLAALVRRKINL
jgi:PEP-CTERM motif